MSPWVTVTTYWVSGERTQTRVRRDEVVTYLQNLPIERVQTFTFDVNRERPDAKADSARSGKYERSHWP